MTFLRILGILALIASGALFLTSNYISKQVDEGQGQIEAGQRQIDEGQSKVDTMSSLFSLNPVAKEVGKRVVTDPGQKKIDQGKERISQGQLEIAQYRGWIKPLQYGAIACFVLGVLLLIFGGKKRIV